MYKRQLQATHYNEFAFPSGMLTVDMLSDSGTTAMTNHQLSLIHIWFTDTHRTSSLVIGTFPRVSISSRIGSFLFAARGFSISRTAKSGHESLSLIHI